MNYGLVQGLDFERPLENLENFYSVLLYLHQVFDEGQQLYLIGTRLLHSTKICIKLRSEPHLQLILLVVP